MTDPLGASPVDREYSVPFLDPAVPVRQTSSDHFVHLREDNKEVEFFSASPSYYMIQHILLQDIIVTVISLLS